MKREVLNELAEAAYKARRDALIQGVYPKAAFQTPRTEYAPDWEDLDELDVYSSAIKDIYYKEAEAVIGAFYLSVLMNGTPKAKQAFKALLQEMEEELFTDLELAETEERKS